MTTPKNPHEEWTNQYVASKVSLPKPVIPAPFSEGGDGPDDHFDAGMAQRAYDASVADQEGSAMAMPGASYAARTQVVSRPPSMRPDFPVQLDIDSESEDSESGSSDPSSSPSTGAQLDSFDPPVIEDPRHDLDDDDEEDGE